MVRYADAVWLHFQQWGITSSYLRMGFERCEKAEDSILFDASDARR